MGALSRLFGAISRWLETRATAGQMRAEIETLKARMVVLEGQMEQNRVDMTKCKFMVGLNQVMDVTPSGIE